MARSRNPSAYPREFSGMFLRAYLESAFTITLPSWKAAKSLQATIYSYARAVRADPTSPEDIRLAVDQVTISVPWTPEVEGSCPLTMDNKENGWMAVALRKALGMKSVREESAEAAEASVGKLLQALGPATPETSTAMVGIPPKAIDYSEGPATDEVSQGKIEEKLTGYGLRQPKKT